MKILIIGNGSIANSNGIYSVNKHTAQFTKELIELGFIIDFLQFEETIEENAGLQDLALPNAITIHSIRTKKAQGKAKKIQSYLAIVMLLFKTIKNYDFIYIFYPGHVSTLASVLSIILKRPYGLYIRGQHNIKTVLGKWLVKHAKFCLTVSDLIKKQLLASNTNCHTIAPMIDFSIEDILQNRSYSNDGKVRCLFVGRIEYRKGIYELIKAIEILQVKHKNLHFNIVGGGDSFDELTSQYKENSTIQFLGQISNTKELLAMYRQADLFIFPSHDEGFPRVLYESMMSRVPVITTMVGGIGGFMKDDHNCLEIEAKNPVSIVNAVEKMIVSKELKMRLVNQATEDISKLFDGTRKKHSLLLKNKLEEYL